MRCDKDVVIMLNDLAKYFSSFFEQSDDEKNKLRANSSDGLRYVEDGRITVSGQSISRYSIFTYRQNEMKHLKQELFDKYINKVNEYGKTIFSTLMNGIFPNTESTQKYLETINPACSSLMAAHYTNVQSDEKYQNIRYSQNV